MHLVRFYDPTSSWYVFRYDQSDFPILNAISEQDLGLCGQLVVVE